MDGHRVRMVLKVFLLASWLFLGGAFGIDGGDSEGNSTAQCQIISMPTKEFTKFNDAAKLLNQYLEVVLVKAKRKPGESEESTLQVILSMQRDMKDILSMQREMMKSLSPVLKYLGNSTTPLTRPADCSEILVAGQTKSGVYEIYPFRCRWSKPVKVFCDMETDGGGWTVFLQRNNTSKPVNFIRNWEDYKNGFGDPSTEYWLGNEHLHTLTFNHNYAMRLEVEDLYGIKFLGQWNDFFVDSEQNKFKLTSRNMDPLSTVEDDYFAYHNNMFFSTFERDNDVHGEENCAQTYKAGWWHHSCYYINPTGVRHTTGPEGLLFHNWDKPNRVTRIAKWLQLKIRPSICAAQISTASLNTHNCDPFE